MDKIDKNKFEVNYSDGNYSIISKKTGNRYELLEGVVYKSKASSDIVFIFLVDENGYRRLVDYTFGAEFTDDCLLACADYIERFERGIKTDLQAEII